jgi:hypothetical protein
MEYYRPDNGIKKEINDLHNVQYIRVLGFVSDRKMCEIAL